MKWLIVLFLLTSCESWEETKAKHHCQPNGRVEPGYYYTSFTYIYDSQGRMTGMIPYFIWVPPANCYSCDDRERCR